MRFFSRLVFICNVCFLISVPMRFWENMEHGKTITRLPFLEGSIVILGLVLAAIFNSIFVFIVLYRKSIRKPLAVTRFLLWFNLILFPIEIIYLFFRPF